MANMNQQLLSQWRERLRIRSINEVGRPWYLNCEIGTNNFYITPIAFEPKNLIGYEEGTLLFDKTINSV